MDVTNCYYHQQSNSRLLYVDKNVVECSIRRWWMFRIRFDNITNLLPNKLHCLKHGISWPLENKLNALSWNTNTDEQVCKIINKAKLSKGIKEQIWNKWYGFRIQVSDQLKKKKHNINQRGLDLFEPSRTFVRKEVIHAMEWNRPKHSSHPNVRRPFNK